jgi:hypothetical protein
MPAHSEEFPWPSHYGNYHYFEERMRKHNRVAALELEQPGVYRLQRINGDSLRVFICECYAFGVAEYHETLAMLGKLNVIVINSIWCGYSPDAKRVSRLDGIGLFTIAELMGALNRSDYSKYLTESQAEKFAKSGWL